jgi:4-carboxymuconolactone decarboxylase
VNVRLPQLLPDAMTAEQLEFYQLFTTGPRAAPDAAFRLVDDAGALTGPPAAWVLNPSLGQAMEHIGGQIRFGLHLEFRASEAAILIVAFDAGNDFELYAHTRAALKSGWTADDIAVLGRGEEPSGATDSERLVMQVARSILASSTLDDALFRRASDALGRGGLFELVTLVGYYRMVALQLSVFEISPPDA